MDLGVCLTEAPNAGMHQGAFFMSFSGEKHCVQILASIVFGRPKTSCWADPKPWDTVNVNQAVIERRKQKMNTKMSEHHSAENSRHRKDTKGGGFIERKEHLVGKQELSVHQAAKGILGE